jgi:hypothetical protein
MAELLKSTQVNNIFNKFVNEEQDPIIIEQVHLKSSQILTDGEEINYIAVQKNWL